MAQPKTPPIRLAADLMFLYGAEAETLGVSVPRLVATDLNRYRRIAVAAVPAMTEKQWGLLSHALDGIEFTRLVGPRRDDLPGPGEMAIGIMDWMRGGGSETSPAWARQLYDDVLAWSPLTIAGVLFRLRAEAARKVPAP